MADPVGSENPRIAAALEQELLERGNAFSFLQAWRTLSRQVREQGGNPDHDIRIRPTLSLALPKASIDRIQRLTPAVAEAGSANDARVPQYEIQTSFLGLYGASSPLPNFYTEDLIAAEQEDEIQARLLLDVFHQRIYRLYASALQKYQPVYELTETPTSNFRQLLWSLIGARDEHTRRSMPQPGLFLQYVNLFARQQKSAAGLHFILNDHLRGLLPEYHEDFCVSVEQCVEQNIEIPARDRLGLGLGKTLGVDAVIGSHVQDVSGKLLVRIGPLNATAYQTLIGTPEHWQGLHALVRAYIGPTLACEVEISVTADTMEGTRLGDGAWNQLGLSTWLQTPGASLSETPTPLRISRLTLA